MSESLDSDFRIDALVDAFDDERVRTAMRDLKRSYARAAAAMPPHADYLAGLMRT